MSSLNEVTAVTWKLRKASSEPSTNPESILTDHGPHNNSESRFEPDGRCPVSGEDIAPGGKYRAIIKLQMKYLGQEPDSNLVAHGTGWLIRPDLMVTAGHNVYNWRKDLGRCTEMKAYMGYNGEDSLKSKAVQFRSGQQVVTTQEWLSSSKNRSRDVAFVKLDAPFDGERPFNIEKTPDHGNEILGVVGYPLDKTLKTEPGAQMYEQFKKVKYDLKKSSSKMLEYRISTYGGCSGSPVLRNDRNTSVGTHVYGSDDGNKASTIMGSFGNPYRSYIAFFDSDYSVTKTDKQRGVQYIKIGGRGGAILREPRSHGERSGSQRAPVATETSPRQPTPNWPRTEADKWLMQRKIQNVHVPDESEANQLKGRDHIFVVDNSYTMGAHWKHVADTVELLSEVLFAVHADPEIDVYFVAEDDGKTRKKKSKELRQFIEVHCPPDVQIPQLDPEFMLNKFFHDWLKTKWFGLIPKHRKPISVYFLTDGLYLDRANLMNPIQKVLTEVKPQRKNAHFVGLQLIHIGDNSQAAQRLKNLDRYFQGKNDIVDTEPSTGNVYKMLMGSIDPRYDGD